MNLCKPVLRTRAVLFFAVAATVLVLGYLTLLTDNVNFYSYKFFWTDNLTSSITSSSETYDQLLSPNTVSLLEDSIKFTQINTTYSQQSNNVRDINETVAERLMEITEIVKVAGVNCTALINGSKLEEAKIENKAKYVDNPKSDEMYIDLAADCREFQTSRGYIMSSLTKEEEDFPLAFSMIVYKDVEMVERLLRAIYRPQNYYCIHVDQKGTDAFYNATKAIASCFPNVFIASKRISVYWGTFSVLEPDLLCMEELWKYPKWRYFINLTGQEFPLKTNFELVKILTAYRGASDILTFHNCTEQYKWRWKNLKAPFGLYQTVGSVHITANRNLVDYMLHNDTAAAILEFAKNVHIPDEVFFTMMNANPRLGIKGTYTGKQDSCDERLFMTRFKMWPGYPCAGRRVRSVCILTIGDLPRLTKAKELFANKFYLNEDRTVIGCLEEKIFNDTRDEYLSTKTFDTTFYSNLDFVIHQIT